MPIARAKVSGSVGDDAHTVYSFDPPEGLTALAADGTDQTAVLQAHMDYVKARWDGGVVDISNGGGEIRFTGTTVGLVVPAGVQLRSDMKTKMYFSGLTTGSAITVNDSDFIPLRGLWLDGPRGVVAPGASYPDHASIGLNITGVGLRFEDLQVRYFGAGLYLVNSYTYIHKYDSVSVGNCGVCVYDDGEGVGVTENGERFVFTNCTLYNSPLGIWATGNNLDLHFIGGSIDYCVEFARISSAWVYFTNAHLETAGAVAVNYLMDVRNNSHVFFGNTYVIMGNRQFLFSPSYGPTNYALGVARFQNTAVYFSDPTPQQSTQYDRMLISWEANATTKTFYVPWPLRYCSAAAEFVTNDGWSVQNDDRARVSTVNTAAGQITVTTPALNAQRWVQVKFG